MRPAARRRKTASSWRFSTWVFRVLGVVIRNWQNSPLTSGSRECGLQTAAGEYRQNIERLPGAEIQRNHIPLLAIIAPETVYAIICPTGFRFGICVTSGRLRSCSRDP